MLNTYWIVGSSRRNAYALSSGKKYKLPAAFKKGHEKNAISSDIIKHRDIPAKISDQEVF
ncbi:MAG: hypothetical protein ACU84H_11660 [Gammaproteobacteria bacterium]